MKKIKNILMSVLVITMFASCEDATEIVQDGELDKEASFQTVSDLQQFLYGAVYPNLSNSTEISFTSVFTDEVGIGPSNGGQGMDLHRFTLNAASPEPSTIWLQHYALINRVNRLLDGAEIVVPVVNEEVDETDAYNNILAEARALRAYSYLQLVSYFSTDMASDDALGVMVFDYVPALDLKLPRVNNSEAYALIEADLLFASANIVNQVPGTNYKFVSKSMIDALYARMYLYRKNYPLAKQYAQAVVSGSGLTLSTAATYAQMWGDIVGGEVIFAASRPIANTWGNIAASWYFNTTSATGGAFHDMGRNLYNLYAANDIRRNVFVDATKIDNPNYLTDADFLTSDVLPIDKYPGKGNQPLRNDLKIFRLSEMYFVLAECAVNDGQLGVAAGYIKNVRDRRAPAVPAPVYANVTAAWADILLERRKELCFEGFRYLDIKRLGVLANQSIDRNITDDPVKTLPTTISNTDYRFTLPIPQDERTANGSLQQNPNY